MSKGSPVNLTHLRARLIDSRFITQDDSCNLNDVKIMLKNKFDTIDYNQAREDVIPFIKDPSKMDLWSSDFFKQITDNLTAK